MDNQNNNEHRKLSGALRLSRDTGIDVDISYSVLRELLAEQTETQILDKEEE